MNKPPKFNNRIRSSQIQVGKSLILNDEHAYKKFLKPEERARQEEKEREKAKEDLLAESKKKSVEIISDAQLKAEEIIQKAKEDVVKQAEEAELFKQQGYEEGFKKGVEEGTAHCKQEINEKIWGIHTLTSAVYDIKKEIINSAEREMIELSTVIAESILRQKLEMEPELMEGIIRDAIDQLSEKEEIKIIVNPALSENLYEFAEELKETIRGLKTIKIVEDRTIPRDGVIVESPESRVDGRLATRMDEIVRNMLREFCEKANCEPIPEEIDVKIEEKAGEPEDS